MSAADIDALISAAVPAGGLGHTAAGQLAFTASSWSGRAPPARSWLVPNWIPAGTTTVLYGDGGTGKSLLTQQLATAVATGTPFLGLEVHKGPVLALFCEDDADELHRRQEAINAATGIDMAALTDLRIIANAGEDSTLFAFQPGLPAGAATDFALGFVGVAQGCALIIIDTAADTFAGKEIDRYQVRQFLTFLNSIAMRTGAAVVLLAHPSLTGMSSGRGQSGSTAWTNGARAHLYLEHDAQDGDEFADPTVRRLSRKKSNYAAKGDTLRLAWKDGAFAIAEGGPGPRRGPTLTAPETIVLAALRDAIDAHGVERPVGTIVTVTGAGRPGDESVTSMSRRCATLDQWRDALRQRGFRPDEPKPETWRKAFQRVRESLQRKGICQLADRFAWEVRREP
jgi:hypothetical protein